VLADGAAVVMTGSVAAVFHGERGSLAGELRRACRNCPSAGSGESPQEPLRLASGQQGVDLGCQVMDLLGESGI
jgi:hypothetical protein